MHFIYNGGNLYIGGSFTNQGDANGDYIVYWDGSSLNSMGTGGNLDVRDIKSIGTTIYAAGLF